MEPGTLGGWLLLIALVSIGVMCGGPLVGFITFLLLTCL